MVDDLSPPDHHTPMTDDLLDISANLPRDSYQPQHRMMDADGWHDGWMEINGQTPRIR